MKRKFPFPSAGSVHASGSTFTGEPTPCRTRRTAQLASLALLAIGLSLPNRLFAQATNVELEAVPDAQTSTHTVTLESSRTVTLGASANGTNATVTLQVGGAKKKSGAQHEAVVLFGSSYTLKPGETTEAVVLFGGNANIQGNVTEAVVVFGGNVDVSGSVGDALVVFGGNADLASDAKVAGELVAIGGNAHLAAGSKVGGDLVTVGGSADISPEATVSGSVQQTGFGSLGLHMPKWLQDWLVQCVFKLRPLSCSVPWVWGVAGIFFLLYLLTALVLRRPVAACLKHLEETPATSFLVGLLGKLLFPLVVGVFAITGIGLLGVPFLLAALWIAVLIGKVALFECFGRQLGRWFKSEALQQPLLALLVGWVLVTLLYLVPVLGFIVMVVTAMWGLGAALLAVFAGTRREKPPQITPPPSPMPWLAPTGLPFPPLTPADPASGPAAAAGIPPWPTPDSSAVPPPLPVSSAPATTLATPEALLFPRAGLLRRVAAAFLDTILIGMVCGMSGWMHRGPSLFLVATVAYFTAMWTWKGTTVGGIVCGLKVVRLDGQSANWVAMLVRSLAAWFGVTVMFLGFLWIAWDAERQGWHDKITGTVVVKLPRGTPLVCV